MRDVWILTAAQAFAACGMIVMFAFGGIVGTRISPVPTLATLPLSSMVIGVALMTIPAALLMQRFGRKPAFILSALGGSGAALLAAWATAQSHFPAFCVACLVMGMAQSFVLQYRFAATEYVEASAVGRAVGAVMLGTLVAAVLGPELGDRARLAGGWPEFTGSFIAMAALMTLGAAVLGGLHRAQPRAAHSTVVARPARQILTQPTFIVAVLASMTAYAVMSFIMIATPISMFVEDGLSVLQTRHVISAHVVAMYAPSLASGWITRIVGLKRMMLLGVACMAACVVIAVLVGHHFLHYLWGLVLLGVGWNLLFVAGTTMLTQSYSLAERFKAQGIHDFATFGVQATVSLLAGTAIVSLGWARLNLLSVPMMAAMIGAVLWLRLRERATAQIHLNERIGR